jgi:hypothetical protein
VHVVGFIIGIYHDARSHESQIICNTLDTYCAAGVYTYLPNFLNLFGILNTFFMKCELCIVGPCNTYNSCKIWHALL